MQIVDAIGSALEIVVHFDHRGFLGDDSFDFEMWMMWNVN